MSRIFIGITLPEEIKNKIIEIQEKLKSTNPDVKWEKKANLHFTLKFLGEISEEKLVEVIKVVEVVKSKVKSHKFEIGGIGVFPHFTKPRILWIGVIKGEENIIRCQNLLEQELTHLGFLKEARPYHAHITMARFRSFFNLDELFTIVKNIEEVSFGETLFEAIKIIKSTLTPLGSIYETLKEIKLK